MKLVYHPLLRIRLRHSFYKSGESTEDFALEPTPFTRAALRDYGLLYRATADGGLVLARVAPDSNPVALIAPLDPAELRLQFLLLPQHAHLASMSDLPAHQTGRHVFYFNNLRDDSQNGRLHLGDSVADARVGSPMLLLTGDTLSYPFKPAVNGATITLEDLFGNVLTTTTFQLGSEVTDEFRLDLRNVPGLRPGPHRAFDSGGGSQSLFYAPDLFAENPFGMVEIFGSTLSLKPDDTELVPAAYQILNGAVLNQVADFHIQIEARKTSWRYHVIEKYGTQAIDLNIVDIVDTNNALTFQKTVQGSEAVFNSTAAAALSEEPPGLELRQGASKLSQLPYPRVTTPLQEGSSVGQFVSEMFVYV